MLQSYCFKKACESCSERRNRYKGKRYKVYIFLLITDEVFLHFGNVFIIINAILKFLCN